MEQTWSARSVRPIVAVYVVMVFGGFMAFARFVLHSPDAVKALLLAAIGSIASLLPSALTRLEYRSTDAGLSKRPLSQKGGKEFRNIFLWDELIHLVPTRSGFRYFKKMNEPRRFVRFLRLHLSGAHSGEFHVEPEDLERVRALIDQRQIPVLDPQTLWKRRGSHVSTDTDSRTAMTAGPDERANHSGGTTGPDPGR